MRSLQLKVCGIDHRILWAVFIGIQSFIFSSMLGTLGSEIWVKLDVDGAYFEGDLYSVRDSNGIEEESYAQLESDTCEFVDTEFTNDQLEAYCDMWKLLNTGAVIYVIFEVFSLVCLVSWGIGLLLFMCDINSTAVSFCCSSFV